MTQTPHTSSPRTTLVVGATGKTGSRVYQRLLAAGLPVRPASRSSATYFDWDDPGSWLSALTDVDAAYITFYPDLALPGAAETVRSFVDMALSRNVNRLVLLSGRGEEGARRAEVLLQESGADWTIVRCGFFSQNFSEIFADAVRYGTMAMPAGAGADPFLDVDDVADVVVAALADDRHIGQLYELSGPRLLTLYEVAEALSDAIGRPVTHVPLSRKGYAAELVTHGIPTEAADQIADVVADALDGRNAVITDGVERVLGRPARDFVEYARDAAATGVWDLPVAAAS
jgi:uncharacterized protein YbjT (DUF2867 family)